MRRIACLLVALLTFSNGLAHAADASAASTPATPLTYEKDIRPLLKTHCFHCHGEEGKREARLDVRLQRFLTKGGDSGPAVVPEKPDESLLIERIENQEMPPGDKKLSAAETALIRRWIATGAKTARPEPEKIDGPLITEEERTYWAFQPIHRQDAPAVKHADRVRTPIDAFLLEKLESQGLTYSADADKRTLIRRAYFDLTGLPPSPEEIAAFVEDNSPNAWEKLVDRLLESPHYGERWGRHWLDVAGYADSEGSTEEDSVRDWTYKYRDYVINAFNANKPFDLFIREQLAGDEMVAPPYKNLAADQVEKLTATGFLRMAPDGTASSASVQEVARNQVVADTIQIVSTSLLGLTVACAQCHDHRYDPIPQTDYYQFRAIFEPAYDWKAWRVPRARLVSLATDADRAESKRIEEEAAAVDKERLKKQEDYIQQTLEKELTKFPENERDALRKAHNTVLKDRTPEQKALLKAHPSVNVTPGTLYLYDQKAANELKKMVETAAGIRARKPQEEFIPALTEVPGKIPATTLFFRGDYQQPRQKLAPAELTVLRQHDPQAALPQDDKAVPTTGRRLAYAKWLTNGNHPLLARVLVNRFWMHHFGAGLVPTPGDFGTLGERPTHPALLDWLASEFMQTGWDLKRLHRLLMTSTAYQQRLRNDPKQSETDPDNRLYGGTRLRRLDAETLRDSILAVSGQLNVKPFGKAIPVMADEVGQFVIGKENLDAGRPGAVIPMLGEEFRRSVYVQVRRSRPLAMLDTFDSPRMEPNCDLRASSTVAPQSLMLLNSEFVVSQSESFAERVRQSAGDDAKNQVVLAWKIALAREPSAAELDASLAFLSKQISSLESAKGDAKSPVAPPAPPKPKKKSEKEPEPKPFNARLQGLASFCQMLLSANEFLYVD